MIANLSIRHYLNAGTLLFALALLGASLAHTGCGATKQASAAANRAGPVQTLPVVETVAVSRHSLDVTVELPGEIQPYQAVAIYSKVTGFVESINVDRGSQVHKGQVLAQLVAPELISQRVEAQAKLQSAESRCIEADAKLSADEATFQRLKVAAATPGVISDDELEVAEKVAEADRARVLALRQSTDAARATLRSVQEVEGYLRITAPFDGVITERNVHPGALVGPSGGQGAQLPMVRIEQSSMLRLVVAVPELYVADVAQGANVQFKVPAYPNQMFTGKVARIAETMDAKTRTMPVELDVVNHDGRLHPGMYPAVDWPVKRAQASMFVPLSAVARTMEGTFVIRIRDGYTQWVNVKTGAAKGDEIEIFGEVQPGELVARRGTDELRPNTHVSMQPVSLN